MLAGRSIRISSKPGPKRSRRGGHFGS
jgi:hypothetical protein